MNMVEWYKKKIEENKKLADEHMFNGDMKSFLKYMAEANTYKQILNQHIKPTTLA